MSINGKLSCWGTNLGIVPLTTTNIVAGLYIARPPTTSFAGMNLANSAVAHPLGNCRLYYSQVTVDPQKSIDYVQRNRNKSYIYRSFVTNSYNNITSGTSFDSLINSGIDTCPATIAPLSLTNLQVSVGGQNAFQSTPKMTYKNFLEQVNLAEQLTSSDFGVSTGLINQGYWEMSKWYFVNVERGDIADKLQLRNINI